MDNLPLFKDDFIFFPKTQGIKYAGSKLKIMPSLFQLINNLPVNSVLDGFAGTTRVSQGLAQLGYKVVCNDIAVWSKIFGLCYLKNERNAEYYQKIIVHLNSLPGEDGWFTENYGGHPNGGLSIQEDGFKKPWQIHNTRKLDAIRDEIDRLSLNEIEKAVLITSLILAMDKVDSTLGHYCSYLRKWSARSYKNIKLKVPRLLKLNQDHDVFQDDIFNVISKTQTDLAYFDPPYGSNNEKMPPSRVRYAAYYHLWKTICLNDKPALFGEAKRRSDSKDVAASSIFEEFRTNNKRRFISVEAIEMLLKKVDSRFVILSYSSGGRATANELIDVLEGSGKIVDTISIDYKKNVMANMRWTNDWIRDVEKPNKEYLFVLDKE